MKNLLTAVLPALALFALGGCASTAALSSTEDDGVYYSSKDRTTAIVSAPAPSSSTEEANPDYHGNTQGSTARQGSGSNEYYDNSYTYMQGVPSYGSRRYYGPGLATYAPYSPYTTVICTGYGPYGYGGCGYSPYAYGFSDPFYNPYYSPYGYGYGSGVSITFGYGRPYYGGGYYGYGRPYGYGYGGGYYDPYYYSSPYYGGYYGRGGYYGSNYYGGNSYYGGSSYYGGTSRYRTSGHRDDRVSDGRYSSGTVRPSGNTASTPTGGGRTRRDDVMAPGTGTQVTTMESMNDTRRTRTDAVTAAPGNESYNQPRRMERTERDNTQRSGEQAQQVFGNDQNPERVINQDARDRRRAGMETMSQGGQPEMVAQPQETTRRRGGYYQGAVSQPGESTSQSEQPRSYERPQRTYEQPQRTYEQPQRVAEQPQRTYEQPQRTYEQPQRVSEPQRSYSQPSYSSPSNGGGGGGGGHSRGRGD